jgi:hypothetical protein
MMLLEKWQIARCGQWQNICAYLEHFCRPISATTQFSNHIAIYTQTNGGKKCGCCWNFYDANYLYFSTQRETWSNYHNSEWGFYANPILDENVELFLAIKMSITFIYGMRKLSFTVIGVH